MENRRRRYEMVVEMIKDRNWTVTDTCTYAAKTIEVDVDGKPELLDELSYEVGYTHGQMSVGIHSRWVGKTIVEVVRCKDCKYSDRCFQSVEFKTWDYGVDNYESHVLESCSYGEKR